MLSHVVQFLSLNKPSALMATGTDQVIPPSVERLTTTSTTSIDAPFGAIPRNEISQTLCFASNATEGSLARP